MIISSSTTPLKTGPLRVRVAQTLRDAIFAGRLNPGDAIRELPVARELGVSQNTVREALVELQQMGLVVRNPSRNTTVTKLSDADVDERISVRILLEPRCFELSASRITPDDFAVLSRLDQEIERATTSNSHFETAHLDYEFHRTVWACSGQQFLQRTLEQLVLPLFAFLSIVQNRRSENLHTIVQRHKILIDALQGGDRDCIADAVRKHILNAWGRNVLDVNARARVLP
jgi:DNA-binding GntR family transcriptional regulator